MSSAVFGAPGGTSLAINDLGQMARTDLENFQVQRGQALLPGELAMQPIQMQHQAALGRLATAQAGEHEQALKESQAMAAAMQGMSQGGAAPDPLQTLPKMINAGFQAGAVRRSMDLLKDYQVLVGHKNAADAQAARARWEDTQSLMKSLNYVSDVFQNVNNQQDQDAAAIEYNKLFPQYMEKTGKLAPWDGKVYSPELAKSYVNYGLTQSQKLAEQSRQEAAAARERIANQNADLRYAQILAKAEQDKKKKDDAEALAKAGGKNLGQPSKDETAAAVRLVKQQQPDLSGSDLLSMGDAVAFEAKRIRQNNPSVTPEQAMFRAYQSKKDSVVTTPPSGGILGFGQTPGKTSYQPFAPGSKDNPIPATPDIKPETGKHYLKNGQVWVARKDKMELVQ